MKKLTIILLLSALTFYSVSAQNRPEKIRVQFNAGGGFSNWGFPIYFGFDFGVHPDVTIGIEGSFRSYNQNYSNTGYRSAIFGFSSNGNYHFNRLLNIPRYLDLYAGANVGYYVWSTPSNYPGPGTSGVSVGGQIGARYFFSNHFGVNLEFGSGNAFSGVKFGITLKF